MAKQYSVTGMKCAGCSSTIEKAVGNIQGVKEASVNLAMGILSVETDSNYNPSEVIKAVEDGGFGIREKEEDVEDDELGPSTSHGDEWRNLKIMIVISLVLMFIAMAEMFGIKLPSFISLHGNPALFVVIQFLLTLPVVYMCREIYTTGFKTLFKLKPNMDSLVALSTAVAGAYSIYISASIIAIAFNTPDIHASKEAMSQIHKLAHSLYFDTQVMILAIIAIGRALEDNAKKQTTTAIQGLMKLRPKLAEVLVGESFIEVPIKSVKLNDIVRVKSGANIPVDGIIIKGECSVDESMLTGENLPVDKYVDDQLIAGSLNVNGLVEVRVNRVGKDTVLSKIIKLVTDAQLKKAPIARLADNIAAVFVPFVLIIATLAFAYWQIAKGDIGFSISILISVLVISCPCALGLATPTAIMVGIGRGAELGIFIKNGEVLENAKSIDTILFDKTGTITSSELIVSEIMSVGEYQTGELLKIAASVESGSNHPIAKSIIKKNKELASNLGVVAEYYDVLSHEDKIGLGIVAEISNKAEDLSRSLSTSKVLLGNLKLMQESKIVVPEISIQAPVLVYIAVGNEFAGVIGLTDEVRGDAKDAISELKKLGISAYMLTGDNLEAAKRIAKEVGLDEEYIIADVLPEDKLNVVDKFIDSGKIVAMVGDGINDAPALMKADISFAMSGGSDIAIESADVMLSNSRLIDVVRAIALSRATIVNIKENLFWAFFYNVAAIPLAAGVFYAFGGPLLNPMIGAAAMSLSSITVVFNALRLKKFKG